MVPNDLLEHVVDLDLRRGDVPTGHWLQRAVTVLDDADTRARPLVVERAAADPATTDGRDPYPIPDM